MKKKNKYKSKKYKKPLDSFLSKNTSLDNGKTVNKTYRSIMKYFNGGEIDIEPEPELDLEEQKELAKGEKKISNSLDFSKLMGGVKNNIGMMAAGTTFNMASASVQKLLDTAMGGGDTFEGLRPEFNNATRVMEKGGKVKPTSKKVSKQQAFIEKYYPIIKAKIKEMGLSIDPKALTSQLGLESNWGTSGLTKNYNNFGGYKSVKGVDKTPPLRTTEFFTDEYLEKWEKREGNSLVRDENGNPVFASDKTKGEGDKIRRHYKVKTPFSYFKTPAEGIEKQIKLIANDRYSKHGTTDSLGNPKKYFEAVAKGGYATDVNYVKHNLDTYESVKDLFPKEKPKKPEYQSLPSYFKTPYQEQQDNTTTIPIKAPIQEKSEPAYNKYSQANIVLKNGGGVFPNKGLEALSKIAPHVVNKMGYASGGMINTDPPRKKLGKYTARISPQDQKFIDRMQKKFGDEAMTAARSQFMMPGEYDLGQEDIYRDYSYDTPTGIEQTYNQPKYFASNSDVEYPQIFDQFGKPSYSVTEDKFIDVKPYNKKKMRQFFKKYANGGMVEVEGGEAFETPNGQVGEFVGPDHSNGGIKMEVGDENTNITNDIVPEGTEIYSKKIKKDKKNMAQRKLKREKYITSLEKKLKENSNPLLEATYNRAKETMAIADSADKRIQEEVRAMEQLDGVSKYLAKYGGKMKREKYGYGGMMKYPNGGKVNPFNISLGMGDVNAGFDYTIPKTNLSFSGNLNQQLTPLFTEGIMPTPTGSLGARLGNKDAALNFTGGLETDFINKPVTSFRGEYNPSRNFSASGGFTGQDNNLSGDLSLNYTGNKFSAGANFSGNKEGFEVGGDASYEIMPGTNIGIDAKYAQNEQGKYEPTGNVSLTSDFRRNKKERPVKFGGGGKIPMYSNGGGVGDPPPEEDPYYNQMQNLFRSGASIYDRSNLNLNNLPTNQIAPITQGNIPFNQVLFPGPKNLYMDLSGLKGTTDVKPVFEYGNLSTSEKIDGGEMYDKTLEAFTLPSDDTTNSNIPPTKKATDDMTKRAMQGYDFTMGDYLGLTGVGLSGLGPMSTTMASRLTDRPNINFYRDFGQDTMAKLEGQKGFLGQQFNMQKAKIGEMARNANRKYQNTARGINQARVMGQMSDMQANDMLQKAYSNYAQQMLGVESQIAQTTLQAEKAFAAGETARDLADRQDRDAFFTNFNKDVVNFGTAMQVGAKALNAKELDMQMNKLMPMLSPYGIGIRKDGKGGYEYYSTVTSKTKTTEEVKADLDKAKQEAAEKANKEETTVDEEETTVDEKKKVTSAKENNVTKVDNSSGGKTPINPVLKTDVGDGNDYIRGRLNFENTGGSFSGTGVSNYGFTGGGGTAKGTAMKKYFDASQGATKGEKAVNAVNNYIIGTDPKQKLNGGNTSILSDLNYTKEQFDQLPEHVKEELVDWKLNTGRGSTDLLLNALDPKTWTGVEAAKKSSPVWSYVENEFEVSGKGDYSQLSKEDLRKARMRLYKGRIKYLKDKYGEKDSRYLTAKKGFENSQQYR